MKEAINPLEYAATILGGLGKGILLTTSCDNRINTMTIGWGTIGVEWGVPIFTTFVREQRHTAHNLTRTPQFTINCPLAAHTTADMKIVAYAGAKSGRDVDKIAHLGLHTEAPQAISVPGLREFPLTLECRVIYRRKQDPDLIEARFKSAFYPQDVDSSCPRSNRDYHIAFYGEIVAAYIIK